ncbi:hypothetical protein JL720_14396 [Aureococcus anophagefferens]|nr:hypothetical protein JL720_14396 [Aureococcus anophagefferens]
MARNKNHCGAPASDCAFLGPPAKYTGRYAVFMAGRVRVAHLALQKAKALIARRYAGKIRVDWYAHVWYNESSLCERRALEELTAIATAITTEPVACMWSWGETGFVNQWHGVDGAFQTLLRFGRSTTTRWPPLARAMAGYGLRSGYACDSSMDSFPWQRMRRYGCWPPVADAAQDPVLRGAPLDTLRVMCRDTAGAAPRLVMMRRAPVRWLALWLACTAAREVNRSAPLPTQLKAFRAKSCPEIDCDHLGPPAKYTGKYAVFMSGRLRVAHAMLTAAMKQIEDKYSGSITVDWYLHVWYNETALCERRALEELRTIATAITTEPVECMWSWGNGWQNQWHGVDFAWRTLERFGDPDQYTLILKSRVDVSYDDLDFEAVWKRYGAAPATAAGATSSSSGGPRAGTCT